MALSHHSLVAWQRADDPRDRLHFLNIAESSLAEVGYCIHVACRLGYWFDSTGTHLEAQVKAVGAPRSGLVRSIRSSVQPT